MKPSKSHLLALVVSFTYFLSACSSTNIFNKTAQLTDVTSSWLYQNCSDSDWKSSSEFKYGNCRVLSNEVKGTAYACEFSDSRSTGLFKDNTSGLKLLCGVSADGIDNVGSVYTDGTSDTSTIGKVLVATAAVAAVAVVAAAAGAANSNNYINPSLNNNNCSCPYDKASDGSRCGARSAWSRSGGETPYCNIQMLTTQDYFDKQ